MAKRIITEEDRVYVDCDFYSAGMTEDGQDFTEDLDETAQECPTCGSVGFRELRPLD